MFLFRATALVFFFAIVISILVVSSTAAAPLVASDASDDLDRSIKPGDDFYRYANGGWLRTVTIPAGQPSFDIRAILTERTSQRVHDLIRSAAAQHAAKGTVAQKVGDYYASFMDEEGLEAKGLTPLAGELDYVSRITDKAS